MTKHMALLSFLVAITLSSCSSHRGLTPIQPSVGHYSAVVVESLVPQLKWEPMTESGALYDVVIFESAGSGKPGKSVYYREGLATAEHKVLETLKPDTVYYWSVRSRRGTDVGDWSTYDHKLLLPIPFGLYYQGEENLYFPFKTPPTTSGSSN